MSLEDLAEKATQIDGVTPFNEATRLALGAGDEPRVDLRFATDEGRIIAAALAFADAPVELVVDPLFRKRGLGGRLLESLLADGEKRFWAHGDLIAARMLAERTGLRAIRAVLTLRRTGPPPKEPEGVVRAFRPGDAERVLTINALAFADHPEQGAMDRADFDRRAAAVGIDGLLVREVDGDIVGFHWTKVEAGVGEVYVIAVDPGHVGMGHGSSLLAAGLRKLAEGGVEDVLLYAESRSPALNLYYSQGFRETTHDVLFGTVD
jgi:mycothiol synthase